MKTPLEVGLLLVILNLGMTLGCTEDQGSAPETLPCDMSEALTGDMPDDGQFDSNDASEDLSDEEGWIQLPSIGRGARQETAVLSFRGEIWVIGGFDDRNQMLSTVEIYSPATQQWLNASRPRTWRFCPRCGCSPCLHSRWS